MDLQTLQTTWFALLGAVWVLYLVLGGIDLGIGQLVRRVDRASALRSIGPTWAANDVWLVIAVAVTLGAFPGWYAELMSGAYLPFVVLVGAVMLRHAGMELVGHATPRAQPRWEVVIVATSHLVPFLWGVVWAGALDGSLAAGGSAGLGLFTPAGVAAGLALTALCRLQGLAYLRLRVPELRDQLPARSTAAVAAVVVVAAVATVGLAAAPGLVTGPVAGSFAFLATGGLGLALAGSIRGREAQTLLGGAAAAAGLTATVMALLERTPIAGPGPHAVVLSEVASSATTLGAMLVITVVLLPLLLLVLGYAYLRFLRPPSGSPRGSVRALLVLAARGTMSSTR